MSTHAPDLVSRAAVHAALGDPTRLRITDLLALSDLAPGEIEAELRIPSNLLAHHLRLLESAGVIRRTRSEGDRRRSYVQLASALPADDAAGVLTAARIVFVCTANSARSQLAAALWNDHSLVPATSAGTAPGPRIAPGALRIAAEHGLDLRASRPRALDEVEPATGDLVITVCDAAHETLRSGDLHWSIADPVPAASDESFTAAYRDLRRRIAALAPRVHAAH